MEPVPEVARIPGAEERSVEIDGVTWRYWYAGSGPPLLLVHGFLGYSFSWRFNVEPLSRYFSVYAMDLPGCGFSQRTEAATCTLAGDAEALLRFMDHLGIQQADIVGSSRGGGLAIVLGALLAKRNMLHRIRRLVLVSPINPWSSNGQLLTRMFATTVGGQFVVTRATQAGYRADPILQAPVRRSEAHLAGKCRGLWGGARRSGELRTSAAHREVLEW